MTDVEYLESRIREQQSECAKLRKKEAHKKSAEEIHDIYTSFCEAGFSDEDAFSLLLAIIHASVQKGDL